ncbi:hypothetical protein HU200_058009 [Digitaria exilis]|uniref:TF-B3 domain-containing protein n=1 Tax=Digitaria exilis TaxID=1010633 RepID=A0A835DZQ9_9POAL|nr:hypothetical protein HU200_058009 [Digitaria exilis]
MATNAKSSSAGGAGAGASHGDLGRTISHHEQYHAFLTSLHRTSPGAMNVHQYQHQCPAGVIQAPVATMPQAPYSPQIATPPPSPFMEHHAQSQLSTGRYPDFSSYGNGNASSQYTRGFADWGRNNNALVSLAHSTTTFGGGFQQNFSSYNTHTWTATYMPGNPYSTAYGPANMNMMLQTPSFHNNITPSFHNNSNRNHEKDSGIYTHVHLTLKKENLRFATSSFMVPPTVLPTSPSQLMSPKSVNYTSTQIFEETNNVEDTFAVFGSGEIESDNSEEPDPTPASEIEDLNQDNGHISKSVTKVNCQDYRMILRKDLTNSDVGNIGRIVLPKKDAEPNLPILEDKDGLMLEMDDFELPAVWKFKYRYWPNNKSRMYILEITGEFVKRHGLQAKDILIIYKNKKSGRYVARAVKAENIQVPECECIKAGNLSEECGFAVGPSAKKASV